MSFKLFYQYCVVPFCENNTQRTPNKLFIAVPREPEVRKLWLRIAKKKFNQLSLKTAMYFCDDHFDMPNDMENYLEYKLNGSVKRIRMKKDCVPTRFRCQAIKKKITLREEIALNFKREQKLILDEILRAAKEKELSKDGNTASGREFDYGSEDGLVLEDDADSKESSNSDTFNANEEFYIKTENQSEDSENLSLYRDDCPLSPVDVKPVKEEELFHASICNECNREITGFRYTCVQCSDFDLCDACELDRMHPHHYMLRVPEPKAKDEVAMVMTVIRHHLLKDHDPKKELGNAIISVKCERIEEESDTPSKSTDEDKSDKKESPASPEPDNPGVQSWRAPIPFITTKSKSIEKDPTHVADMAIPSCSGLQANNKRKRAFQPVNHKHDDDEDDDDFDAKEIVWPAEKARIIELSKEGCTVREIADELDLPEATVQKWIPQNNESVRERKLKSKESNHFEQEQYAVLGSVGSESEESRPPTVKLLRRVATPSHNAVKAAQLIRLVPASNFQLPGKVIPSFGLGPNMCPVRVLNPVPVKSTVGRPEKVQRQMPSVKKNSAAENVT